MERTITTVIRTNGETDTVFINGIVSKEIERLKLKHEAETKMLSNSVKRKNMANRKIFDSLFEQKQESVYDQFLRYAVIPYAIYLTLKEKMIDVFGKLLVSTRGVLKAMFRGIIRFGLKYGLIEKNQ